MLGHALSRQPILGARFPFDYASKTISVNSNRSRAKALTENKKSKSRPDVFTHDGEKAVGAVRQIRTEEIVVYIENAGDFEVLLGAVMDAPF